MNIQNPWDAAKVVLRGKFRAWSGLAKIQLNLIKKMNFKGEVVLNLNLVL